MNYRHYRLIAVLYLIINSKVTQGCDFYCCEGDRTAFVEAGWQNCCSEEQCFEVFQRPTDWGKIAETRRKYYRPQPCNIQCCRGRSKNSNLTCCSEEICGALSTMDSMTLDELFAQDLVQNMHQLRDLEWPVTESWASFDKNSSHSSVYHISEKVFPWHHTTTEDPEEIRRKQEIADAQAEDTRADTGDLRIKIILVCICLVAFVLGVWWRYRRHQRKMARRAHLDEGMAGRPVVNRVSVATPLVVVTVVPASQPAEHLAQTHVVPPNGLPLSYQEVADSTTIDVHLTHVLPEKR